MKKSKSELYQFEPIGVLHTCFKEKFGIPRQSGMVAHAKGLLKLKPDPSYLIALKGLDSFSHIWVVFVFHQHKAKNWKPSIRPPRLGGAKKVGVLASRSPHRPNPIGLSAVKLLKVDLHAPGGPELHLEGVDILDGTPVIDIKPYLPYADIVPDASSGWAGAPIPRNEVEFTDFALEALRARTQDEFARFKVLIQEMLELDPRPASQRRKMPAESPGSEGLMFGFRLFTFDVRWQITQGKFVVMDVVDLDDSVLPKQVVTG